MEKKLGGHVEFPAWDIGELAEAYNSEEKNDVVMILEKIPDLPEHYLLKHSMVRVFIPCRMEYKYIRRSRLIKIP